MGDWTPLTSRLVLLYDRTVLGHPLLTLLLVAMLVGGSISYLHQFRLDASADTLVLENDQSLAYYRAIKAVYGSDDSLIITYTPKGPLFSAAVIDDLRQLRDQLAAIERVESVTSLLDVPLLESPPVTLSEIAKEIITLEHPRADRSLAQQELTHSPLYRNLLINLAGDTTALEVLFKRDDTWHRLLKARNDLRVLRLERKLSTEERSALARAETQFDDYSTSLQKQLDHDIATVRTIMDQHLDRATLYLGGVPMIAADSINFVRLDLMTFGIGVFAFLVLILTIIFRRARWVLMAISTCIVAGASMMGLLGLITWPVTVVSSNFISLLLILTLSLLIHLIVRYRELLTSDRDADQRALLLATVQSKFIPCLYTAITTMVAFGSLLVSGIRPVIDFGWMMMFGIAIAMTLAFTLFPAALVLLRREGATQENTITVAITRFLARSNERYGNRILLGFSILSLLSVAGISQLTVENRFIDYYKSSTEIYQGMELIDRQLGGTTPMDVIIDAPASFLIKEEPDEEDPFYGEDEFFADGMEREAGITGTSYWFNSFTLERIAEIHDYLDSLEESGKVLSLTTTLRMLQKLDPDIQHDNFALAVLYKRLPQEIRSSLFAPYLSADGNQLRFSIRIFESDPSLKRQELLEKIRHHLTIELGLAGEQVKITGMVVLFNNMLQSLFRSLILTSGVVFVAIMFMFALLFRNLHMAAVAIVPNLFAAAIVLGLMGWLRIPLDMMTITIAAICIGIAVDDTIHYIHRFSEEFRREGDYWAAARRSHDTIGRAMYYTTITISLGFSILAFSNFIPTIYFGLLTGFSMIAALVADMTILPLLIIRFKPLGPERSTGS
ncbi:efflux RND transporter permease subunit [Desulfogranum mediterraneum]|uniref:efflux RND transporter permease subunit n=1 Tax=Desulfogranum mediterraneum TaxID=160661 RepID=UPI00054E24B4|nr:MMPL family transporter [Desulfogranum mediterraneum]